MMENKSTEKGIVFTIGHSTRPIEDFIYLLRENNVSLVVDVRTKPRSRHNPQFNGDTLPDTLSKAGINYQHITGLGGLRRVYPNSLNLAWRNASFRGFADYMQTSEFERNLEVLIGLMKKNVIALMCAEAIPWRCHRSLIADALLTRGVIVEHLLGRSNHRTHILAPWARIIDGKITYPSSDTHNK